MEIGNWRPITIGSMLLRLFTRVITKRMTEACPIHPKQRGFRPTPGGAENIEVLRGLIRHCKEERSPLTVAFIDFAQAFDSVSHEHILSALGQINVDPHVVGLIQQIYTNSSTSVEVGGRNTPDIEVRVGVKQGDPLSPLLFNLAMDPLIHGLERFGKGYIVGDGLSVVCLAFADDLVVIGGSWSDMAYNLGLLDSFCQSTGLKVQPAKCRSFLVKPCSGSFSVNDCAPWVLGGRALQQTTIAETVKYLGVKINPWSGVTGPNVVEALDRWVRNIGKSLLKPSQRVVLLNQFALPRLYYQVDLGEVTDGVLRAADGKIRGAVKKWLHLSPSTYDGLIYARNRDGGLGICKLARHIPSIQARRLVRLACSSEPVIRALMASSFMRSKLKGAWVRAGGTEADIPSVGDDDSSDRGDSTGPMTHKCDPPFDWRQDEFLRWIGLPVQGVGLSGFRGSTYIAALQLRAGVYPTREFQCQGRSKVGAGCRRCPFRLESCSHILGQCPAMQRVRIARHHKLCRLLGAEAETLGWEAHQEWEFRTRSGVVRRLDLVLVRGALALVIDVTVRFEFAPDTLAVAERQKVDYYSPYTNQIATKLDGRKVLVFGFPLGARGLWHEGNYKATTVILSRTDSEHTSSSEIVGGGHIPPLPPPNSPNHPPISSTTSSS
ncbi:unnamed protein product [Leuciscus chuanchicus]